MLNVRYSILAATSCSRGERYSDLSAKFSSRYVPMQTGQTVCKPGSVPPLDNALGRGWPFIWDARRRAPRATDPSGGAEGPPGGLSRDSTRLPLLLGLAPGGVYPAATVAGGAVRSYRTISPLPPA